MGLCRSGGEDGKASAGDPDKREHQIKVKKHNCEGTEQFVKNKECPEDPDGKDGKWQDI